MVQSLATMELFFSCRGLPHMILIPFNGHCLVSSVSLHPDNSRLSSGIVTSIDPAAGEDTGVCIGDRVVFGTHAPEFIGNDAHLLHLGEILGVQSRVEIRHAQVPQPNAVKERPLRLA